MLSSKLSESNPFADEEEDTPWGAPSPGLPPPSDGDLIAQAVKKEKIINEITAQQEGLRAILNKITAVEGETQKLAQENLLLDQYILNLAHRG